MEEKQLVRYHREDAVAVITLDNPPLNLLTPTLLGQLKETVEGAAKDKEVRAVVLTAAGERAFCAGADVTTFKILPPGCNGVYGRMIMDTVSNCPLPVIAAIDGYCLGGGMELALACDIRIASEEAKIGLTEANLGLIAGYGGATRLPWLIGEGNAKLMIFTGDKFSGQECKELGVVQFVVPREELMNKAMSLAQKLATKGPISIAVTKEVMAAARQGATGAGFLQEAVSGRRINGSYDAGEGIRALKEKRQPKFENR